MRVALAVGLAVPEAIAVIDTVKLGDDEAVPEAVPEVIAEVVTEAEDDAVGLAVDEAVVVLEFESTCKRRRPPT